MNIEENSPVGVPALTAEQEDDIRKLAAVGLTPDQIAAAMELPAPAAAVFVALADVAGSAVARLIAEGRANGIAAPQQKLQEAATAGNIDAIKELRKLQRENRFNELVYYMDDDEFAG